MNNIESQKQIKVSDDLTVDAKFYQPARVVYRPNPDRPLSVSLEANREYVAVAVNTVVRGEPDENAICYVRIFPSLAAVNYSPPLAYIGLKSFSLNFEVLPDPDNKVTTE
jgi:hypothetical protein